MRHRTAVVGYAAFALALAVFTGTAFAGGGNGDGNGNGTGGAPGNSANAPGQVKQDQAPAAPAPQAAAPANKGQAKKAEKQHAKTTHAATPAKAAKHEVNAAKHAQKKATKQHGSGSYKQDSHGTNLKNGDSHRHTICHATGSATNPYVMITPSVSGVYHGHTGHQDARDIIPPYVWHGQTLSQNWDAAGQAIFAAGCSAPAKEQPAQQPAQPQAQTAPCVATVTVAVPGYVLHHTGSKTNPWVKIKYNSHSAHVKGKHADDIVVAPSTMTKTVAVECAQSSPQAAAPCAPTTQTVTVEVPGYVLHATHSAKNPFVRIKYNAKSAHVKGKHAGDIVVAPHTETRTVTVAGTCESSQPAQQAPATSAVQSSSVASGGTAPATEQASAGGVKGATATLTKPAAKSKAGVLGATARIGSTIASARLPFTGLPLWIFVAAAAALIAIGFTVRRSARGQV